MPQETVSRLNKECLQALSDNLPVPQYSRNKLVPKILHIGVGGFHRSHMAAYTDELLNDYKSDWSIHGLGLTDKDTKIAEVLHSQDCLYTLITCSNDSIKARVVGSITKFTHCCQNTDDFCEHIAKEDYRIISLTVTENGYYYTGAERNLNTSHPEIVHDLVNPQNPKTAIGFLFRVAQLRSKASQPLPTFLSCDNLPKNGDVLQKLLLQFANEVDQETELIIAEKGKFPNSMVDRITPKTTTETKKFLSKRWGVNDAWPVFSEAFRQWYVEDKFSLGRPDWENVGVKFVKDVTPFELMKIRLLNGTHSAMGYVSDLLGYQKVSDAVNDININKFIINYMKEIIPTLGSVPGVNLEKYQMMIIQRFSNPEIPDQIERLCEDGSGKIPNAILSPLVELIQNKKSFNYAVFTVASWIYWLRVSNKTKEINDPNASMLINAAKLCENDISQFLALEAIFPLQLRKNSQFIHLLNVSYSNLLRKGIKNSLNSILN